jgi:hypothetical protein
MIHSFLLIGQSNAAGRGFLQDAQPLDTCDGRLQVLRNGLWLKMFRPVNPDRKFSGTCLAETFAKAYAQDHPDIQVGIIPCADGGTCIEQWLPGEILFDNAVNCARLAMRSSQLVGILWHQGESDCRPERHPFYRERLQNIITSLRLALGKPDLPVLIGGLGDYLKDNPRDYLTNYTIINDQLQQVAAQDEHCVFVSAEGLTPNPDILHFSAEALNEFGDRYHEAFKTLPDYTITFSVSGSTESKSRTEIEQL